MNVCLTNSPWTEERWTCSFIILHEARQLSLLCHNVRTRMTIQFTTFKESLEVWRTSSLNSKVKITSWSYWNWLTSQTRKKKLKNMLNWLELFSFPHCSSLNIFTLLMSSFSSSFSCCKTFSLKTSYCLRDVAEMCNQEREKKIGCYSVATNPK